MRKGKKGVIDERLAIWDHPEQLKRSLKELDYLLLSYFLSQDSPLSIEARLPTHGAWFDLALDVLKKNAPVVNPSAALNPNPSPADDSRNTLSTALDGQPTAPLDEDVESTVNGMLVALPESTPRLEDIHVPRAAKDSINFRIIYPNLLPARIFSRHNLARVANLSGILLFGPPGCGKTFVAKSIAKTLNWTYVEPDIGALRSKWIGDSEKIIIRLFQKALSAQPTLIFIDETDALVGDRSSNEGGVTSRQITNQLLAKWDVIRQVAAKVMMMGAINHPWDIDGAFLRRFNKRIHIGLPDMSVRFQLIKQALTDCDHTLSPAQMEFLAGRSYMKRLSCDDIVSNIESIMVNMIGNVMESHYYKRSTYKGNPTIVACGSHEENAYRYSYNRFTKDEMDLLDLEPITLPMLEHSFERCSATALAKDVTRHIEWARELESRA